jgi:hypothetical protein
VDEPHEGELPRVAREGRAEEEAPERHCDLFRDAFPSTSAVAIAVTTTTTTATTATATATATATDTDTAAK